MNAFGAEFHAEKKRMPAKRRCGIKMTAGIDRIIIHCCDCGKNFSIFDIGDDLISPRIRCPHCGRNGSVVKECRG